MIEKISQRFYLQNRKQNITAQESKENRNLTSQPIRSSMPISKYSPENMKANYMLSKAAISFGATNTPDETNLAAPETTVYRLTPADGIEIMSNYKPDDFFKGDFYKKTADNLAILMGPDKNVLLALENDVEPDLMIQAFTKKVQKGDYLGQGLSASETEIFTTDALQLVKRTGAPGVVNALLASFNASKNGTHKVVFVKNFENFVQILNTAGIQDVAGHLANKYPNVSIIGIMPKDLLTAKDPTAQPPAIVKSLKNMDCLDLNGLSTKETKELFKLNPIYLDFILNRYDNVDLNVSKEALNEIIDRSAVSIDGALPKKALALLDLIATAKADEKLSKSQLEKNFELTWEKTIKIGDVEKFFNSHSDIIDLLKSDNQNRFQIAENVTTKLSDVGGIGSIKDDIKDDIVAYLKNPKKFLAERGTVPKGVLLEGPPGTGKTLLARAIAGETHTPFFNASGSEFVEKYVGVGASRIRELFANAKRAAQNSDNKSAIIFIDEFDALARARGGDSNSEREQTLNQLLVEMDGFNNKESEVKIIVIAATNRKDILDPASIRAGRFDDTFTISNPKTKIDRLEILNIHARKLKFANEAEKTKILDDAAKMTDNMSGADIASVMSKAQKVVSKRTENKVVTHNDVVEGFLQTIAGPINNTAEERPIEDIVKTVRHEGGHAVLIDLLKQDKISFITLDSRGDFLGSVFFNQPKINPNFKSVIISAAKAYAGGIAEPNFDKTGSSAGVSGDVNYATDIIKKAITQWALGIHTPPISISGENDPLWNAYMKNIQKDIELFSSASQKVAKMAIDFHRDFLDKYVQMFENNAGKGGNNLSGEAFSKLRQEWLVQTNNAKKEQQLIKNINSIIDEAHNSNKGIFKKITQNLVKAVR